MAQSLLQSGPMVGYSTMREVCIWVQTSAPAAVKIEYWNKNKPDKKYLTMTINSIDDEACTAKLICDNLEEGQKYSYQVYINNIRIELPYKLEFQTQNLWQWRQDPPSFSFAAGSCTYINEDGFDRPGKPYGDEYQIFTSIHKLSPNFMLWLGDNTYLREADWDSWSGILKRNTHTRSNSQMQPMLASMHNYAIWDDHDFGPNDSDRGFWNKEKTLEAFKLFWPNPSFGINGKPGITSYFQWADVDFFLMDDRYYKSPNDRKTGQRQIWGDEQIEWLIDNLAYSKAPFKIIVTGGQVLNPTVYPDNFSFYSQEKEKILRAIEEEKIEGVVFITGDVHRSEITKLERKDSYPLYDFTVSPLTSGPTVLSENSLRLPNTLIKQRNFALFNVSGKSKQRELQVVFYNSDGKELVKYAVNQNELKYKK